MQCARLKLLALICCSALALPVVSFAQLATSANLPSAPVPVGAQTQAQNQSSSQQTQPSLQDLGISAAQTRGNAQEQALLNKRTHMLKVHQTLGLITAIPMAAALITGPQAKAKGRNGETIQEPTQANLDFHMALGSLTTGLYFTTAWYAIRAPRLPGVKKRGAIRFHEALAWIHGPGMVLTPVLGILAYRQESRGEKVHGLAVAHGPVAVTTAIAYGTAIVAVSWPIHLKL